jgi:hypothetical protein
MAQPPDDKNQHSSKDAPPVPLIGAGVTGATAVTFGVVPGGFFMVSDEETSLEPPEPFIVDG